MSSPSHGELSITLVAGRSHLKWAVFAVVASITLVADLFSKRLVLSALLPQERIELLPFLALQRTSNRGVAFGLLSGRMSLIIAAAAVSMVVVVLYFLLEPRPVLGGLAGGFLLGGSLGNMVERVTAGSVTDFLKIPHYPTFNLADIFIVVGVLLVALSVLLGIPERESGAKES